VAALSAEITPETRAVYVAAGADDVLAKALSLADLRRSVSAVSRKRVVAVARERAHHVKP